MARLVIVGAGEMARLACVYFRRDTSHEVVAYAVDAAFRRVDSLDGLPVVDTEELPRAFPPSACSAFVAIGYSGVNRNRARKYAEMKAAGYELASYVSPRASYLADAPPGDNCFILEQAVVQPFAAIGNDVVLWSGARVCHDSIVQDHCFVAAGAVILGRVHVAPYCFVGAGATIRNDVELATSTVVGAGAVIMEDTQERGVYVPPRSVRLDRTSDDIDL
jgi:sugar O-acyltransferase (sialic acid O-acetyltransferase NeuD family)